MKDIELKQVQANKAIYMLLLANDLFAGAVTEMLSAIKRTPLYKQNVKKECKQLKDLIDRYQFDVYKCTGNKFDEFTEVIDVRIEELTPYLNVCINYAELELRNAGERWPIAISHLIICESLIAHHQEMVPLLLGCIGKITGSYPHHMEYMALAGAKRKLNNIGEMIVKTPIDLKSNKKASDAWEMLTRKMIACFEGKLIKEAV